MEKNQTTTNRLRGQEKKMEMDWAHSFRTPAQNVTRQSLRWNPQGRRKRGRPRSTWEQDLKADLRQMTQLAGGREDRTG